MIKLKSILESIEVNKDNETMSVDILDDKNKSGRW